MDDAQAYAILAMSRTIDSAGRHQALVDDNPHLKSLFSKLGVFLGTADDLALKLTTSTKVYTQASNATRDKCALDFSVAASVGSSYGAEHDITDLKGLNLFTQWSLRKCTLQNQKTDSEKILEVINTYKTPLGNAGISAAFIQMLTTDHANMVSATAVPQNMIDAHKNNKILLNDHLAMVDTFYEEKLDKGMVIFKIMDVGFYLDYLASRKVKHHHMKRKLKPPDPTTGILELLVLEKVTLEPFAGATLVVTALNITTAVDEDGETYNSDITAGTYHAKISCEGYKDLEFNFTIVAGKTCSMQFLMEKVA